MYLKSIEIQGFKSFADRVLLEFHSGITGIVGPNGSGKSNVADAVRWVLGEQSAKQLRGTKMEDIIFAGTQLRKKLGFAYVAITFDNDDHKLLTPYDEVKVARRVYRSGESEYLLNGSICRLKDVQELFLDTGIGKEGYSIIGQGQIEKILSGRPEERRELFDEAAGIAKFKRRKQDAIRNLEEERKNLVRIKDIISELEIQMGPLKQQAEKAQKFLAYREELKEQEMKQALLESEQVQGSIKELEEKLFIAKESYQKVEESFEKEKKVYEELEEKEQKQKLAWSLYQQELSQAKVDREKHEGNCKVYEEKLSALEQRKQQNESRKEEFSLKEKERKLEEEKHYLLIEKLQNDNKQSLEKEQEIEKDYINLKEEIEERQKKVKEKTDLIYENKEEFLSLKANLERYQIMLDQNALKKADYKKQLLIKKSNAEAVEIELAKKEELLQEFTEKIDSYQKKKMLRTEEHNKLVIKLQDLSKCLEEKQIAFHRENSRLESLRNITERYEGFGNSIKRVMEQRNTGVLGVVSDVIRVKKQYELAMEAALGGSIQNIVTNTEETAKKMIAFLKENKYGRATFLPLTGIFVKAAKNQEVLKEQGVIGYGNTLVSVSEEFEKLADFLLGRTLIVDTIDHAISIARKYKQSIRIVTLDGEVINLGGAMSGGAFRHAGNLLGRRREMDDLEKKTKKLLEEIKEIQEKITKLQNTDKKDSDEFEVIDQKLQELSLQENTAKLQKEQLLKQKKELTSLFQGTKEQEQELIVQSKGLKTAIENLQQEMAESEQKELLTKQEIEKEEEKIAEKTKLLQKISSKAENIRMENASVVQKINFEKEHLERLQKEKELQEMEQERIFKEIEIFFAQEKEIKEKIKQEIELAKGQQQEIAEKEKESDMLLKKQQKTTQELKVLINHREDMQKQMSGLDKECYRLNTQKETKEAKLESLSEYMWKEYQVTLLQILEITKRPEESFTELRNKVQELKEKKKALGDVNVNAIEDFRQLSKRYDLFHGQYEDVIAAEQVLLKIIDDLDKQMREQFQEKFFEIQQEFQWVFQELFGGGQGTLELTEEEDVLQAGIRINAQPPGKRLQNMMQLSGGEKSLTAIALLFAIQNLKPSPFCLLDEIEAALDDANVKRFAKYLHNLTGDTQFLVITHRKGTMAAADVLYGITMQEKGISTLVSVSLIEEDLS